MDPVLLDSMLFGASILLIVGLRKLSTPDSANAGNSLAAMALGLGVLVALFYPLETRDNNYLYIAIGLLAGSAIGLVAARRVVMTAMPEMVSLFNGFGGLSAALISMVWLKNNRYTYESSDLGIVLFNLFLGLVAFVGSMVAFGKLNGRIQDHHLRIPFARSLSIAVFGAAMCSVFALAYFGTLNFPQLVLIIALSMVYGILFVAPIGGADMPVVISSLNALTGITAAVSGVITDNKLMLLGGVLVGSSGIILTLLMCKAMNRPVLKVFFSSFTGGSDASGTTTEAVKEISAADLAILLAYSERVCIIPGYGMAVAQAQKVIKEVEEVLEHRDVEVKYAIHPVAGRMPGHMNVLLAEADVTYDKLLDLDDANAYLETSDVAIVVGANDVVNPSAKRDPGSKIYGMPILDLSKTRNAIVLKRGMSAGYAGIQNPLFFETNTRMFFGDAKASIKALLKELKAV